MGDVGFELLHFGDKSYCISPVLLRSASSPELKKRKEN